MDFVGNRRTPAAIDHIGGAVAQMIQARAMQTMGVDPFKQVELEENID